MFCLLFMPLFYNSKLIKTYNRPLILIASKKFKKEIFFVLNPDTIWSKEYKSEFRKLEQIYLKNKIPQYAYRVIWIKREILKILQKMN